MVSQAPLWLARIAIGGEAGVGKTAVLLVLSGVSSAMLAKSSGNGAKGPAGCAGTHRATITRRPAASRHCRTTRRRLGRGLGRPTRDGLAALHVQALALAEALGSLLRQQPWVLIWPMLVPYRCVDCRG